MDPALREPGHVGEVDAVVDAEREVGIGERERLHELVVRAQQREHVRQVELALGVVAAEPRERGEQRAAVEQVEARVDLADRELLLGRVARGLGLDDALDAPLRVADDAAVAGRVLELHARDRRRGAGLLVRGDQRGDRLAGDERHVAVDDQHGRGRVDRAGGGGDRVAGAAGLRLDRDLDVAGEVLGEPPLGVVDDDDALGAGRAGRQQRPQDHRPPADRVQHLGQR